MKIVVARIGMIAMLVVGTSRSALAQDRVDITVHNATAVCTWITFTAPPKGDAIFGTASGWGQVKEEPRTNTGPLFIAAGKSYTFHLPRTRAFRLRAEVQNQNCPPGDGGGTQYDTNTTVDDMRNIDVYDFTLKKGNGNFFITRTRS